jgi:hypothetical protein
VGGLLPHAGGSRGYTIESDDKRRAHFNCIAQILASIDYEDALPEPIELPPARSARTTGVRRGTGTPSHRKRTERAPPGVPERSAGALLDGLTPSRYLAVMSFLRCSGAVDGPVGRPRGYLHTLRAHGLPVACVRLAADDPAKAIDHLTVRLL